MSTIAAKITNSTITRDMVNSIKGYECVPFFTWKAAAIDLAIIAACLALSFA